MDAALPAGIAVSGAGIGGLTAALCFAAKGFRVTLFEREARLEEAGAGIQLSPNATRILARLGVIAQLGDGAVRPQAIALKSARDLRDLSRLPLGEAAQARWGAPYIVAHRADLQRALLARVAAEPGIEYVPGRAIDGFRLHERGIIPFASDMPASSGQLLLVGADGVWSTLRMRLARQARAQFSGYIAWRALVPGRDLAETGLDEGEVTALLDPDFHLVAYPVKGGDALNLVAVTKGGPMAPGWSHEPGPALLGQALARSDPALSTLCAKAPWKAWPIFTADLDGVWTHPAGVALIGDAAHAMTPFAAQGAAMAIEDAAVLAGLVAEGSYDIAAALAAYETLRRERVRRVARRGDFNRFVWHARGPIAFGRDVVLKARPGKSLMRDFDWLYGFDAEV